MSAAVIASPRTQTHALSFMPREHGATAMLLIPFFSAAILAREWHWAEIPGLIAAFCTFAAKDPLVVLARQRWVWKQHRPETGVAKHWVVGELIVIALCGLFLLPAWPVSLLAAVGAGAVAFSALAVAASVKNKQRSTLFQIVSAAAVSSTSLVACVSATGSVATWCWWLWVLCALQATAGILVVHARLEARIAARKSAPSASTWRRPALAASIVLLVAAIAALSASRLWIAAALAVAGAGYLYDLHRQKDSAALQMPLKNVGQQALTLSIAYALMVIAGLW